MQKNRIGIGVFAIDKEKGTDSDIYLLRQMRKNVSCLCVVCNTTQNESIQTLKEYVDNIFFSKKTIDKISCYKFLLSNLNKNLIEKYDELILFDNSLFGPFYDLKDIFSNMQTKKCDFWGLLRYGKRINSDWKEVPDQLNTGFLVIRPSLFKTAAFSDFFSNKNNNMNYFLDHFSKLGYSYSTYIENLSYLSALPQNNFDVERYMNYELIHDLKYPFLKKSCFKIQNDDFDYGIGEGLRKTVKYIQQHLSYDVNMIWDSILHTCNIAELHQLLHLEYVLPWQEKYLENNNKSLYNKTVVVIYLYYMDLLDEEFSYIAKIPKDINIIIISQKDNEFLIYQYIKRMNHKNVHFLNAGPKGRDIAALLVTAHSHLMQYEYLCFIHDKKTTGDAGSVTVGKAFRYIMWENLLKSESYINNILQMFLTNPRLGLLAPPEPEHADYFSLLGNRWSAVKNTTEKLLHTLNIDMVLNENNDPFVVSTSFWCRTTALKKLFTHSFQYEDFSDEPMPLDGTISHAIEKCLIYVAQDAGYFSGIVENIDYAGLRIANSQRMLSKIIKLNSKKYYFTSFKGLCQEYAQSSVIDFCTKYKKKYIYGAGNVGMKLYMVLINRKISISGFIISDGQKMNRSLPAPCYYLSEVHQSDSIGIIVAATKKYKGEMIKHLLDKGWHDFFCKDA